MPTILTNKLFSLYVRLRYPSVPANLRYFYRDTYNCEMTQIKYIFRDFLFKKKYKDIYFSGEFAPELQFALPFAYWHHLNGTLRSTHSSKFTKELYFFSENHFEDFEIRTNEGNYNFELPRILYSHDYDMRKWVAVPLKKHYQNDVYVFSKPILIIANRYNMEWDGPPISFYDIETLDFIISKLKNSYTIIYNRPRPEHITTDNSDTYDLNEYDWLGKEHPEVILMENLFKENKAKANNFNHLQLMVYANASKFISVHGGTAALASYFGGVNLVISKQGPEHHFNCYNHLYPKLSGASIYHAKSNDEVRSLIEEHYI
ncbi:hypothetical protein [Pedobacter heparinus]|uniref:Glycosyltransferase family 61 protein n=1 Tax=Pedobacter heparinus (strain ATCC 13125 / DSM 2366 / CIP 104194 / JCM 7457 / NBRC 12017 / NCIMB 9290 / NRRL B-14731 / HIM 762-3) TaxID=485917 RepID=C6XW84_PEDHD|nr:hypothetical protein [Pedobacter heparinus]ACU04163.1 hypothetical protein Phep_1955 [Pedobacter heparinus DSM 2366]